MPFAIEDREKGHDQMESQLTPAQKVRRTFNSGPRRSTDLVRDAEDAALQSYADFRKVREKVLPRHGLSLTDVRSALLLIHATSPTGLLLDVPSKLEDIVDFREVLRAKTENGSMVVAGVAYWLRDNDPRAIKITKGEGRARGRWEMDPVEFEEPCVTWTKPWLASLRAKLAWEGARIELEQSAGTATAFDFVEQK